MPDGGWWVVVSGGRWWWWVVGNHGAWVILVDRNVPDAAATGLETSVLGSRANTSLPEGGANIGLGDTSEP